MLNKGSNKNSTSKYKGVSFSKDNKSNPWRSIIFYSGKQYRLGYFATEDAAAIAYDLKAEKLDKNFLLNSNLFTLNHNAKKRNTVKSRKSKFLHLASKWKSLYSSGKTYKEISKDYNISAQTISNTIKAQQNTEQCQIL